jgi:hypothetical protein
MYEMQGPRWPVPPLADRFPGGSRATRPHHRYQKPQVKGRFPVLYPVLELPPGGLGMKW